jgi:hypothetical protein
MDHNVVYRLSCHKEFFNGLIDYRHIKSDKHTILSRRIYAEETTAPTTGHCPTEAHHMGTDGEPSLDRGDPGRGRSANARHHATKTTVAGSRTRPAVVVCLLRGSGVTRKTLALS